MSTANCYVDFWENDNKDGRTKRFNGPIQISNLSDYYYSGENENFHNELDDSISSLATGSQAWLVVYTDNDYKGQSLAVNPNTTINKLSDYGMDNDIASFQLFDQKPVDYAKITSNFLALYPGSDETTRSGDPCIEFYAQDAQYRIYYPTIQQSGNVVSFQLNLDHIRSGGSDDHAVVTFKMDTQGNFVEKITITYDMSSGAYNVPDWVLNLVDDGIDELADEAIVFLDGAEVVLTAGIGTELVIPTDILILAGAEVLTFAVNHINNVIDKLFGLSDDGGTMYFSSAVAHSIGRLMFSYMQERYAQDSSPLVYFDQSAFQNYFNTTWDDENKDNPCFTFSQNGSTYRSYYPDNTAGYSKAGYLSSVKIDAINDNEKDDHLILLATFDPDGKLFSVQGSIDIYGAPDDSDDTDDYVAPSSGTIAYDKNGNVVQITKDSIVPMNGYTTVQDAYKDLMQYALYHNEYVDSDNFSTVLSGIVDASYSVLLAIDSAVRI